MAGVARIETRTPGMGSWIRAATRNWSPPPASASSRHSSRSCRPAYIPRSGESLAAAGIEALWAHQADAFEAARRGHTIVTTGTASGKSLAFNLPVLDTLATDLSWAFYLYPTKALAQDQARALARLGGRYLRQAIYDGDTLRRSVAPSAGARTSSSPTRTCSTSGCCPTTAPGATCSRTSPGWWSTRRMSTAACSVNVANVLRRLRRLANIGEPSRASCSRARRSPTGRPGGAPDRGGRRAGGPRRCAGRRSGRSQCGTHRSWTRSSAAAPRRSRRPRICWPSWSSARCARSASSSRAGVELIQRFARERLEGRDDPTWPSGSPLPRRLHTHAATRDRTPAGRGEPRGGGHERARARHRRGRPSTPPSA